MPLHEQSAEVGQERDCSTPVDCLALVKDNEMAPIVKCRCISTFNKRKIRLYHLFFSERSRITESKKRKKKDRLASNLSREEKV